MAMFASLFGSSGSDKSDKMRQQALDAFNAVKTPELSSLQVQLQKAVVAGTITPEQAEAQLLNSNAFNNIKTDPSLVGAQKQALQQLQNTASAGGLDAIDKSKLQDIRDQQEQENRSDSEAILANARARGMGNSNLTAVQRLIANQGSTDRASKAGTDVAAQSQARALAALQSAGQLAGNMQSGEYAAEKDKAISQNAIDQFNAANRTDTNKFNVANNLSAQGANVGNAQAVENKNTDTKNAETVNNANANQTVYNDELQKANGQAGVLNGWANDASAAKARETGADMALTGGVINGAAQAGGYALAGPAGGAAMSAGSSETGFDPKKMSTNPYGQNYPAFSEGGEVPDPNSTGLEDEYQKFVQNFCNGGTVNMADGGKVHIKPGKKEETGTPTPELPITSGADGKSWQLNDPNKEPVGEFSNYADAASYAEKVREKQPHTDDFQQGGKVDGMAPVAGDSPKNDIVPAKLSPGEVVASRTEASNFEKKTGVPLEEALKRLKNPTIVGAPRG